MISVGLFALALVVRLVYAAQFNFPPLDDPAYYIQTAHSFFTPHPLQVAIIWNFEPRFVSLSHPALDYWQPLPAFAIALSMAIFGQNLLAAQLPAILAGACLPLFTWWLGQRIWKQVPQIPPRTATGLSVVAAFLIAINPLLVYQSASPDSSMLYAALVGGVLLAWDEAVAKGGWRAFGVGGLASLAYLARTPAVFLVLAWLIWLVLRLRRQQEAVGRWQNWGWLGLGLALPVIAWSIRNLLTFGFVTSPAGLQTLFIFDYQSLFNYQNPVNFNTFVAAGPGPILQVRLEALANAWDVLNQLFFPSILPAFLGLLLLLQKTHANLDVAVLYNLLLFVGLPLLFGVASTNGTYYHSVASGTPVLAIGLVYGCWWLAEWVRKRGWLRAALFPLLTILLLSLNLLKLGVSFSAASQLQNSEGQDYRQIAVWLTQHPTQAVISNEPSTLNYATGVPSIRLPAAEGLDSLAAVANFYHADYLVLTANVGQYPALLQTAANTQFTLVYSGPDDSYQIYHYSGPKSQK